jgi:hypothetical protein
MWDRFTVPVIIVDPYLPSTDAMVAQIIAPTLQIAWLAVRAAPRPSWCSTSLWTLVHCTNPSGNTQQQQREEQQQYEQQPVRFSYNDFVCSQGGKLCVWVTHTGDSNWFVVGVWWTRSAIGRIGIQWFRLLVADTELINDILFVAMTIITWRLYLAKQMEAYSVYSTSNDVW